MRHHRTTLTALALGGALALLPLVGRSAEAPATPPPPSPAPERPLDVREPPFGDVDSSWMNGNNRQPPSLLTLGPVSFGLYADAYWAFQLSQPADHTIFQTSVAPRHNEVSMNLAGIGMELNGLDGPIGRLYLQYGANTETTAGQDITFNRGFYLTNRAFDFITQVGLGWHFHFLHGVNAEVGIFPSYVGGESYLTQENWTYMHPFISDFTPYYFSGIRVQMFLTRRTKLELWLVNGWQTFGQWHEGRSGGLLINWRPRESLSLAHAIYFGQEVIGDPGSLRAYSDNNLQLRYYRGQGPRRIRSLAFSAVFDFGYERRGNAPSGILTGGAIAHRFEWSEKWASTIRGDIYYDPTQALLPPLPTAPPLPAVRKLPDSGPFLGGGLTLTVDFLPSPWLLLRAEYAHRNTSIPYLSGSQGITGPGGALPKTAIDAAMFTPDLRTSDDRLLLNATLRL